MRVLFLSTWFPCPPDNGSKIRVYHLLRALSARHQVTLISFAFDTAQPDEADILRQWGIDVHVVRCNPFKRSEVASALRFLSPAPIVTRPLPEMTQVVQHVLNQSAFDVVIASIEVMAVYALMTPRSTLKILEEHNSLSRWMWERYHEQSSGAQRLRCWISWMKTRLYEAQLFGKFDLCVMASEQDRAASLNMLPGYHGRVEVAPNGVNCQHNLIQARSAVPNSLIYNGALTYHANYEAMQYFLAEVYPILQRAVPDITLTITGSTQGVDRSGLKVNDSVHFSGYVADIRPLIANSAVCVVPIQQGGGTRLKILEAMALGIPIVATSKGAEGIDAVNGEQLLIADDAETFAQQVLRLLHDANLRQHLIVNARSLVEERYDWGPIGHKFVELVEQTATSIRPAQPPAAWARSTLK